MISCLTDGIPQSGRVISDVDLALVIGDKKHHTTKQKVLLAIIYKYVEYTVRNAQSTQLLKDVLVCDLVGPCHWI